MTTEKISEDDVREMLKDVKHPAINRTLLELGIIKKITAENDNVHILLAFPFPNIPIKEHLISSIRGPLEEQDLRVEIETTVMDEEELHMFLVMEQKDWKGGI